MNEVLQKTTALQCKLLRNIKVQKTNNTKVALRISVTALLVSLLATCSTSPSYAEVGKSLFGGNSDFVEQLSKISYLPSISEIFSLISNSDFVEELNTGLSLIKSDVRKHHIIASYYQPLNNHSFNYIELVAVNGNNVKQELQNLLKPVQHHTIVDVFYAYLLPVCPLWVNCALP